MIRSSFNTQRPRYDKKVQNNQWTMSMFNCALFHGPTCFSCAGASLSAHSETINQFAKQLNSTLHVHVCGELATRKNFHRATADTFLSSSRQFTFLSAAASCLLSLNSLPLPKIGLSSLLIGISHFSLPPFLTSTLSLFILIFLEVTIFFS